ncbi:MAG: RNA polymerase-binding protein DksA [Campylobacterales bacterium]|nr:RNA polymerase-binding protein DksA [Campylobacterales bacterium]
MLKAKDIAYFEQVLAERKEQLLKNIESFAAEQHEAHNDDIKDEGDHASANGGAIIGDAIILQQKKELEEIEYAFTKIKNKTYGVCEMCEDPIGLPRLKAKPFARYCIVCREIVEKENKAKGK